MEIQGSGKWSVEAGKQFQVEREFIVPWGGHVAWTLAQIGTPDPLFPACICRRASVEPMGVILGSPGVHTHAKVTLTYIAEVQSGDYQMPDGSQGDTGGGDQIPMPPGARIQIQARGGGEFMLVPARTLRWADNMAGSSNGPIPQEDMGVGKIVVPMIDWIITLSNLQLVNTTKLDRFLGCVNANLFFGYEPEVVLFEGYDVNYEWSVDNGVPRRTWSCSWHFKARPIRVPHPNNPNQTITVGWNHEYRGEDGWKEVRFADNRLRYPLADFKYIFLPN